MNNALTVSRRGFGLGAAAFGLCAVSSLLRHLGVMTSETFGCHDF